MSLRRELLRFATPDGGLELFDPVMERIHLLSPAEAQELTALEAGGDASRLLDRLASDLLLEGVTADMIREAWWARKRASVPPPPLMAPPVEAPWVSAEDLPAEHIGETWRRGESWRKLAEERASGSYALPLRDLLAPDFAASLAEQHRSLAYERMAVGITWADRHVCTPDDGGPVATWLGIMASAVFRGLMGAVLGVALPPRVTANAWRMLPGDEIRAHPVGTTYVATISLGLNADWTAADLGGIAFADAAPGDAAFAVRARWLPHLGDGLAIARGPASWHWVEPPLRERRTLTGWWVAG